MTMNPSGVIISLSLSSRRLYTASALTLWLCLSPGSTIAKDYCADKKIPISECVDSGEDDDKGGRYNILDGGLIITNKSSNDVYITPEYANGGALDAHRGHLLPYYQLMSCSCVVVHWAVFRNKQADDTANDFGPDYLTKLKFTNTEDYLAPPLIVHPTKGTVANIVSNKTTNTCNGYVWNTVPYGNLGPEDMLTTDGWMPRVMFLWNTFNIYEPDT